MGTTNVFWVRRGKNNGDVLVVGKSALCVGNPVKADAHNPHNNHNGAHCAIGCSTPNSPPHGHLAKHPNSATYIPVTHRSANCP